MNYMQFGIVGQKPKMKEKRAALIWYKIVSIIIIIIIVITIVIIRLSEADGCVCYSVTVSFCHNGC